MPLSAAEHVERIVAGKAGAYALLHRPATSGPERVELITGEASQHRRIGDIPLPDDRDAGHHALVVVPYRQVAERGFAAHDDGTPLTAITVAEQAQMTLAEARAVLPADPVRFERAGFDLSDDAYAAMVRRILLDEIGRGSGANFVIKRTFLGDVTNWSPRTALSLFGRLLGRDPGSFWTFLVNTGDRVLVGSSPERHVSLNGDTVVMNPISGTLRYPPSGPVLSDALDFLADEKEAGELYMVLDEELKMMAHICDAGCRAHGPYLREMARVAHTEYVIEGRSSSDVRRVLRDTLLAPTIAGGPLESACSVIDRYEPDGRGYYGGVLALIGRDAAGDRQLDSAIIIRTADIAPSGRLQLSVGATLVRDSDPQGECHETRAKAAGMLEVLEGSGEPVDRAQSDDEAADLAGHPAVRRLLAERNAAVAPFWFRDPERRSISAPGLLGRRLLVIDGEDSFTAMARQIFGCMDCEAVVSRWDADCDVEAFDAVIVGPGPGDPNDVADPKIARMRAISKRLLAGQTPFLAVCLGHQVLCTLLGLAVSRKVVPSQGAQHHISIFGRDEQVGFYNTYAAKCATDEISCPRPGGVAEVFRDPGTGEVHGLRGPGFASIQFHAASVLTPGGVRILATVLSELVSGQREEPDRVAAAAGAKAA
jgi:2-amino-4-deoxychorismate synthase